MISEAICLTTLHRLPYFPSFMIFVRDRSLQVESVNCDAISRHFELNMRSMQSSTSVEKPHLLV